MIDLCKVFGVEEGEEFRIGTHENGFRYRIYEGELQCANTNCKKVWNVSCLELNNISGAEVIKLLKKKEFTDDELAIMRSLPKKFKWIARDKADNIICLYQRKPTKNESGNWNINGDWYVMAVYKHLFKSITSEDEEPIYIDDYVERQGEE